MLSKRSQTQEDKYPWNPKLESRREVSGGQTSKAEEARQGKEMVRKEQHRIHFHSITEGCLWPAILYHK